jgi:hypothetical protein
MIASLPCDKFRLDFGGLTALNLAVQACGLSLTAKTLQVSFYESIDGDIIEYLQAILDKSEPFLTRLQFMNKTREVTQVMLLHDLELIDHSLSLSYIGTMSATHECVFSFGEISKK